MHNAHTNTTQHTHTHTHTHTCEGHGSRRIERGACTHRHIIPRTRGTYTHAHNTHTYVRGTYVRTHTHTHTHTGTHRQTQAHTDTHTDRHTHSTPVRGVWMAA